MIAWQNKYSLFTIICQTIKWNLAGYEDEELYIRPGADEDDSEEEAEIDSDETIHFDETTEVRYEIWITITQNIFKIFSLKTQYSMDFDLRVFFPCNTAFKK